MGAPKKKPKKQPKELPDIPGDYDTKTYAKGESVVGRLIPTKSKLSAHRKHVASLPTVMNDIPPSMLDGCHYRWDGFDFIAVPPQTGGPWHPSTVVPQGFVVFFNDGG